LSLTRNALKFTFSGFVKIKVRRLRRKPTRYKFSMADSGIGMKMLFLNKLQAILERKENRVSLQIGKTVRFGLSVANSLTMPSNGISEVSSKASSQEGVNFLFPCRRLGGHNFGAGVRELGREINDLGF